MNYKAFAARYATALSILFLTLVIIAALGAGGLYVNRKANFLIFKIDDALDRYFEEKENVAKLAREQAPLREPTVAELEAGAPVRGNSDAPVLVSVFMDFQCPWCKRAQPTLKRVLEEYDGKVKLAFRHFPLGMHRHAENSSIASACAARQGKFWEYYDLLFEQQGEDGGWGKAESKEEGVEILKQYAAQLGLNTAKFNECLDNRETMGEVQRDIYYGNLIGVQGTPSVFVGDEKSRAQYEVLKEAIDEALSD